MSDRIDRLQAAFDEGLAGSADGLIRTLLDWSAYPLRDGVTEGLVRDAVRQGYWYARWAGLAHSPHSIGALLTRRPSFDSALAAARESLQGFTLPKVVETGEDGRKRTRFADEGHLWGLVPCAVDFVRIVIDRCGSAFVSADEAQQVLIDAFIEGFTRTRSAAEIVPRVIGDLPSVILGYYGVGERLMDDELAKVADRPDPNQIWSAIVEASKAGNAIATLVLEGVPVAQKARRRRDRQRKNSWRRIPSPKTLSKAPPVPLRDPEQRAADDAAAHYPLDQQAGTWVVDGRPVSATGGTTGETVFAHWDDRRVQGLSYTLSAAIGEDGEVSVNTHIPGRQPPEQFPYERIRESLLKKHAWKIIERWWPNRTDCWVDDPKAAELEPIHAMKPTNDLRRRSAISQWYRHEVPTPLSSAGQVLCQEIVGILASAYGARLLDSYPDQLLGIERQMPMPTARGGDVELAWRWTRATWKAAHEIASHWHFKLMSPTRVHEIRAGKVAKGLRLSSGIVRTLLWTVRLRKDRSDLLDLVIADARKGDPFAQLVIEAMPARVRAKL